MSEYPQIFRLRQCFERPRVADVAAEVEIQLAQLSLGDKVRPGQSVAITAGSRGIANIPLIVKAIVEPPATSWAPNRLSCRPWAAMPAGRPRASAS